MTTRPTPKAAKRAPTLNVKTKGAKGQKRIYRNGLAAPVQIVEISRAYGVYAPRLRTLSDWHLLLGKVTRAMLKGLMPPEIGTRFAYVVRTGAEMAKALQEIKELEALRTQLEALKAAPVPALGFAQAEDLGGSPVIQGDLVEPSGQGAGQGTGSGEGS